MLRVHALEIGRLIALRERLTRVCAPTQGTDFFHGLVGDPRSHSNAKHTDRHG